MKKWLSLFSAAMLMLLMTACGGNNEEDESAAVAPDGTVLVKTKQQEEGEKYLAENAKKEGVTVTASGLQYRIITKGNGTVSPGPTDRVEVHYTGRLVDGTVFDSSEERGEPATFGVNEVIPGWTEALQLMHEGDEWELVIPAAIAYGNRAAGDKIKPGSTLIFNVKLLKVLK